MFSTGLKSLQHRLFSGALGMLACLSAVHAQSLDIKPSPIGFGSKTYVWANKTMEQVEVLKLTGDPVRGKEAYRVCQGCHRSSAAGRPDGTYPRLAGQHAVVIIKQVTDTRAGIRVNPKMAPFASDHAVTTQEIADIAVYLSTLPAPLDIGKGPQEIAANGAKLYEQLRCGECHGPAGQGEEAKVYPAVAAQHYAYLLREMGHVRDGLRGNSHPDMVRTLKDRTDADLQALASYLSRLPDARTSSR